MSHALQSNIDVLRLLSEEAMRRSTREGEKSPKQYQQFQEAIRICITEQSFFKKHIDLLQTFADRRSLQVGPPYFALIYHGARTDRIDLAERCNCTSRK